jgi:hypothetical protein
MPNNSTESFSTSPLHLAPLQPTNGTQPNASGLRYDWHRQEFKQKELPKGGIHSGGDALR